MTTTSPIVATLMFVAVVGVRAQGQGPGPADQFYAAIRTGDAGQVKALVETGADVNVKDRRGGATPHGRGQEMSDRIQRAMAWLQAAKPLTTEDRSFRVLGLVWGGAEMATLRRAASAIVATQCVDGGWAQRDEMASDAYATGLTVFALRESGMLTTADPATERAAKYLLSTQRADGSWYVRSRSPKFQPYFEGGFPYGQDQWISSMATGWATAALATAQ